MTTTLTIHDTFEPYYAGRDGPAKKSASKQPSKSEEKRFGPTPNRTKLPVPETAANTDVAKEH